MSISYTVQLSKPAAHIFKVTQEISQPDKNGQILSLPAWIPGSYMIRDFAKNVIQIKATSNNSNIELHKIDKSTWQAEPVSKPLILEYEIYAWDLSVRTAHMDMTHAFFNGSSLFLMAHGFENEPCQLEIKQPENDLLTSWKVATTLNKQKTNPAGFGLYSSNNYDELIDHPVEIGNFTEFDFQVQNVQHKMVLTGPHRADDNRLKKDLVKICETHCSMFGEFPVTDEYLFLVMVTGDGYGGLEHRSSTSLMCSRNDLPLISETEEPNEKYRNFLGLCSHEYFHTWNVKRIKPEVFMPYDLANESYTKQLWAFEGITSYYDELALIRSGVISCKSYLELIGQTITRVLRGKGRLLQSVAESSFEAWTRFYKQDESAPNTIVSYYAKGGLIALVLDLTLRKLTHEKHSLDDVMRYLWLNFGKKNIGLVEGQIEQIINEVCGVDLNDFFARFLYGVEDLPLETLLAEVGIRFNLRPTISFDDKGGTPSEQTNAVAFGARFAENGFGVKIVQIYSDSSAESAGLAAGDTIIAINELQVTKSSIEKVISSYPVASKLVIHAFRRDELKTFELTLKEAELTTCYLEIIEDVNEETLQKRNNWLTPGLTPRT